MLIGRCVLCVQFAFQGCTKLVSVTIPDGVTSIGSVSGRVALVGAAVTPAGGLRVVICRGMLCVQQAFYEAGLTSVTIPDGVTTIGIVSARVALVGAVVAPAVADAWSSAVACSVCRARSMELI